MLLSLPLLLIGVLCELSKSEEGLGGGSIGALIAQLEVKGPGGEGGTRGVQYSDSTDLGPFNEAVHDIAPASTEQYEQDDTHHASWMNSGKFQGDIAGIDPRIYAPINDGRQYNAIRNRQLRWTNGVVPYVLANNYTPREKSVITRGMETYHQRTCIKFVPRSSQRDYLYITKSYGCYSQVGRVRGRQELSLGNGCIYHEIAVHELMHALGFWHEHSRADRDQFIKIQWHNIIPGMAGQFDKISTVYQDFLGETYDYRSVMHYDSRAFSKNGLDTIETVQPGFTRRIGKAKDLSDNDLRKINKLYQCRNGPRPIKEPVVVPTQRPMPRPRPGPGRPGPRGFTFKPPTPTRPPPPPVISTSCSDKFLDCPFFHRYCFRRSFYFIMRLYCPKTCGHCGKGGGPAADEVPKGVKPMLEVQHSAPLTETPSGFGSIFSQLFG